MIQIVEFVGRNLIASLLSPVQKVVNEEALEGCIGLKCLKQLGYVDVVFLRQRHTADFVLCRLAITVSQMREITNFLEDDFVGDQLKVRVCFSQ